MNFNRCLSLKFYISSGNYWMIPPIFQQCSIMELLSRKAEMIQLETFVTYLWEKKGMQIGPNVATKQTSPNTWTQARSESFQHMIIAGKTAMCIISGSVKPALYTRVPWRTGHLLWNLPTLITVSERLFACSISPQICCLHEIISLNSISWAISPSFEKLNVFRGVWWTSLLSHLTARMKTFLAKRLFWF